MSWPAPPVRSWVSVSTVTAVREGRHDRALLDLVSAPVTFLL